MPRVHWWLGSGSPSWWVLRCICVSPVHANGNGGSPEQRRGLRVSARLGCQHRAETLAPFTLTRIPKGRRQLQPPDEGRSQDTPPSLSGQPPTWSLANQLHSVRRDTRHPWHLLWENEGAELSNLFQLQNAPHPTDVLCLLPRHAFRQV